MEGVHGERGKGSAWGEWGRGGEGEGGGSAWGEWGRRRGWRECMGRVGERERVEGVHGESMRENSQGGALYATAMIICKGV